MYNHKPSPFRKQILPSYLVTQTNVSDLNLRRCNQLHILFQVLPIDLGACLKNQFDISQKYTTVRFSIRFIKVGVPPDFFLERMHFNANTTAPT